jgi:hypothetical protein
MTARIGEHHHAEAWAWNSTTAILASATFLRRRLPGDGSAGYDC